MASFRFCETYLLHIKPFVVNKSADFSILAGDAPSRLVQLVGKNISKQIKRAHGNEKTN